MKVLYYPGCTIKRNAPEYERCSLGILKELNVEVIELEKWYCCGATFSLVTDDLMKHLGAIRTLVKAQSIGGEVGCMTLMTLCPMCYNVLRRVNDLVTKNPDKLDTISKFMDEEPRYRGGIEVVHFTQVLSKYRDKLANSIRRVLKKMKVVPYYGCTLVRPKDIAIDNPEDPRIIDELLKITGVEVVDYPFKTECCGSYITLISRDLVLEKSRELLHEAKVRGADVIVTTCPLCHYNLKSTIQQLKKVPEVKVMYLSEVLAFSLGLDSVVPEETKSILSRFTS